MAITKRTPRGPRLPKPLRAKDILLGRATTHKPGPSTSKRVSRSQTVGIESIQTDSEDSFSPFQIHPSRLPPYLQRKGLFDTQAKNVNHQVSNTPIQLLSVDSREISSNQASIEVGLHGAIENTQNFKNDQRNDLIDPSNATASVEVVEETPLRPCSQKAPFDPLQIVEEAGPS